MAFELVSFAALVAMANAGLVPSGPAFAAPSAYVHPARLAYAAPVAKAVVAHPVDDYDPNPQYSYSYDVHDSLTGDDKSQQETCNGDVVEGSYSFVEADGSRRVVHYTADPHNGFNAVVEKQPATVAVKTVAPVHVKTIAPVYSHSTPVYRHSAPVYGHSAPVYGSSAPLAYSAPLYHH